ncbi:putative geranylgeranyl pyrophosphate synthase 7, chloroplastic [Iris pallida]|uniref:Geranylgeranyl pyrophosphate synthase 7, chloroplastic n=1 Tax=Iris pallida TaxID=29817 RepID=A0AAX6FZW4_IRIPA|nr:putative geranylgeranyl pyrophosphate synthase 7, chloroplastic [Iris pallida]
MAPTFSYMARAPKLPLFSHGVPPKSSSRPPLALSLAISSQHCSSSSLEVVYHDIKAHTLRSLPADLHPSVAAPMRRLISAAPPTAAPALCLAACHLVGGSRDRAINAACCVQLMHAAFHVHGRCSAAAHAPGVELMTGDGILSFGYEMLSEGAGDPERVLRAVVEIASATGARGVLEGQLMEAEGEGEGLWVRERKEGRLFSCSAACGAILGGGSEEEVERLRRFGLYVGMMRGGPTDASAETFRSLARLELKGFEPERVEEAQMLYGSWWYDRCTEGSISQV